MMYTLFLMWFWKKKPSGLISFLHSCKCGGCHFYTIVLLNANEPCIVAKHEHKYR